MINVVIESPYAGDVDRNKQYAKECMQWCIKNGYAPFASHLIYTQVLDDDIELERGIGISCGYAWLKYAAKQIFFMDYGMSKGMEQAEQAGKLLNVHQEYKLIYR